MSKDGVWRISRYFLINRNFSVCLLFKEIFTRKYIGCIDIWHACRHRTPTSPVNPIFFPARSPIGVSQENDYYLKTIDVRKCPVQFEALSTHSPFPTKQRHNHYYYDAISRQHLCRSMFTWQMISTYTHIKTFVSSLDYFAQKRYSYMHLLVGNRKMGWKSVIRTNWLKNSISKLGKRTRSVTEDRERRVFLSAPVCTPKEINQTKCKYTSVSRAGRGFQKQKSHMSRLVINIFACTKRELGTKKTQMIMVLRFRIQ